MNNTNKRIIQVIAYNPQWPELYQIESKALSDILTNEIIHIHHIGSTAVPGLSAKPVIDILLEVSDVNTLDSYNTAMEQTGYTAKGEFGIPGRRFYMKGNPERTHNVHAFNVGSSGAVRHIAFRDYLIAHPLIASDYGILKQKCAIACDNNIDKYCDMKNEFIKIHEENAIEWLKRK